MPDQDWVALVADHKQRQALHIARTAIDLAAAKGLAGVSMSGLAQAAGVARATLYNYFPDVQTAIRSYLSAASDGFYSRVIAAVAEETGPPAKLRRYVVEQVSYVDGDDHRAAAGLMENGALPPRPAGAARPEDRQHRLLVDILGQGMGVGAFRQDMHVEVVAALVQRMLHATHDLLHKQHIERAVVISEVLALVESRVLPTPLARDRPFP